jgi:virulence-associated protein VagC
LPAVASAPDFAFKSGTAINLFLRDMPRLSVDIDLTYLPVSDRNAALTDVRYQLATIAEGLKRTVPGVNVQLVEGDAPKLLVDKTGARIKVEPSVVIHGNQALRIPREFELKGEEAILRKEGDRLIIEPIRKGRLLALLASLKPLEETFPDVEEDSRPWTTWIFRCIRCVGKARLLASPAMPPRAPTSGVPASARNRVSSAPIAPIVR